MDSQLIAHFARETKRRRDEEMKCARQMRTTSSLRLCVSASLAPSAFTLVELMVAMALVLILMLGVNQVFKMTTQTLAGHITLNAFGAGELELNSQDGATVPAVVSGDMVIVSVMTPR